MSSTANTAISQQGPRRENSARSNFPKQQLVHSLLLYYQVPTLLQEIFVFAYNANANEMAIHATYNGWVHHVIVTAQEYSEIPLSDKNVARALIAGKKSSDEAKARLKKYKAKHGIVDSFGYNDGDDDEGFEFL